MLKVFLADDEMWIILGLKKLIQKSGLPLQVIGEAADGITALEEVKRLSPDILFSDIRMPGLSGIDLVRRISEEKLPVQTVLISGYAEFSYAKAALRYGAFDYILKPIQEEELNGILARLLRELTKEPMPSFEEEVLPVSNTVMNRIITNIQEGYTQDISLALLSEKYSISSSHLSALIKRELGLSFSEYITAKRMQKARELLKDEQLSIESIAEAVGYHDYFYFTKVFKKNHGISPSKYRKNL